MKVVHCKREPFDVYVGRPSIYGNPFVIGPNGTREEVIEQYRNYALKRLQHDPEFTTAIHALRVKVLGCWCAPKPCHGDVLLEIANE